MQRACEEPTGSRAYVSIPTGLWSHRGLSSAFRSYLEIVPEIHLQGLRRLAVFSQGKKKNKKQKPRNLEPYSRTALFYAEVSLVELEACMHRASLSTGRQENMDFNGHACLSGS